MQDSQSKPSRRGFFFGAVATGAAAAVVVALPGVSAPVALEAVETELPKPEKGGGYSLSDHVKRYYQTTRL